MLSDALYQHDTLEPPPIMSFNCGFSWSVINQRLTDVGYIDYLYPSIQTWTDNCIISIVSCKSQCSIIIIKEAKIAWNWIPLSGGHYCSRAICAVIGVSRVSQSESEMCKRMCKWVVQKCNQRLCMHICQYLYGQKQFQMCTLKCVNIFYFKSHRQILRCACGDF